MVSNHTCDFILNINNYYHRKIIISLMQYNARSKQEKYYLKQDFKFMIKASAFTPLFPSYKIYRGAPSLPIATLKDTFLLPNQLSSSLSLLNSSV